MFCGIVIIDLLLMNILNVKPKKNLYCEEIPHEKLSQGTLVQHKNPPGIC